MKVRTKFAMVILAILFLGAALMVSWLYFSSSKSLFHQATEGNVAFSEAIIQAVEVLMGTGEQSHLDNYLQNARKLSSVAEVRVIRSTALENELGVKESSRAQDDLDRQTLGSGQRIVESVMAGPSRAIRIVSPIRAGASCLTCHPTSKEGDTVAALNVVLVYQSAIDEMKQNLIKSGAFQFLIISFVLAAIFIYFDHFILGPVSRIGKAVKKFGKGDWAAVEDLFPMGTKKLPGGDVSKNSQDEISELATAFNEMALSLKQITVSKDVLANENEVRRQTEAALLESKKRFDQLSEESATVNWEVDVHGLYTYVGHVSEMIFGYRPEELVGRMHFYDLHPEEGREAFKMAVFESFKKKEKFLGFINSVQAKDGHIVQVSTNAIPLVNPDGTLRGYSGSDTDVTERLKAEELMKKRTKELEVFYKSSIGREERIIELKKEVEKLKKELGERGA